MLISGESVPENKIKRYFVLLNVINAHEEIAEAYLQEQ